LGNPENPEKPWERGTKEIQRGKKKVVMASKSQE
jgi:hypothetical protein